MAHQRHSHITLLTLFMLLAAWISGVYPLRAQADPGILEFAMITDTHQFGPSADVRRADHNVQQFIEYCDQTPTLQFALFGGDFYNAYQTSHDEGIAYLTQASQAFSQLSIPLYATRGNHDCNGKYRSPGGRGYDNAHIVTDRQYYQLFSPLSTEGQFHHPEGIVIDDENPYGNYYYRDFEAQRVRLIVLNNYGRDSLEVSGYHGQQMKWLTESALDFRAKDNASDWSFLILGHAVSIDHSLNPITRLLHAYVRGQDFFDTDGGVTYGQSFSLHPVAHFIGFLGGHYHEDGYANWDGYNIISLSRGYASGSEYGQDEVCFDHFVIDTRTHTIEERRIGRGQSRLYSYDVPRQLLPGKSFPEAVGMGQYTVGGRFGRIIHVTNLLDDGPGSLRSAIDASGSRTIVFDVEGTIELQSPLVITSDSLTIAGQSSPGQGITLQGAPLVVDASEVIIRYLSLQQLTDRSFGRHHLMVDHVTAYSDTATALSIRRMAEASVQYCSISTGSHQSPAIEAGGFMASYIYNHIHNADLALHFPENEGENRWIQVARNLFTNWGYRVMYGGGHQGEFTIHENYFVPGLSTYHQRILDVANDGTARYWLRRNQVLGQEQHTANNTPLVNDRSGVTYDPLPYDTLLRPLMHPVARPHEILPVPSCLTVAAFQSSYFFGSIAYPKLQRLIQRQAGSHYRPEAPVADSMLVTSSRSEADVIGYLDRIVEPERSIVVLYDVNAHCRLDGYPYFLGLRDPIQSDSAHVAYVSCGDFLQGGLAASITHGQAVPDIMQHIPYDAIALGTHDFDYSFEYANQILKPLNLPVICSNFRDIATDTLLLQPYVIKQYGRRRVAFIGVTTPSTQVINQANFSDSLGHMIFDFDPPHIYQRVQRSVNQARAEGADHVVVLSQLGYFPDRFGISAPSLIAATSGIDAVLDGHTRLVIPSQHFINHQGQPVLYSQAGENFTYIGKLVIDPDGQLLSELIPTQQMKFRDPEVAQVVEGIKSLFMGSAEDYAGRTILPLTRPREYREGDTQSFNAGTLVTDAMRWAAEADISWINIGSIRQSLPAGELTRGDIHDMLPYENEIITIDLPGHLLFDYIRRLVRNLPAEGAIISPFSGMQISFSRHKGKRYVVQDVKVYDATKSQYGPIDPNRTYRIAMTDYCATIGRRAKIYYRQFNPKSTGELYSEAVFRYINRQLNGLVDTSSELFHERAIFLQP